MDFLPHQQTDIVYNGFLRYEAPLITDKLALTKGSKLEHNNFSGLDYQPSVRLLWSRTKYQSAGAAITRAVRTPSRMDHNMVFDIVAQAISPPPIFVQIVYNPKFKAKDLIASEAGYRAQLGSRLHVDFAGYFNIYLELQGNGPIGLSETIILLRSILFW